VKRPEGKVEKDEIKQSDVERTGTIQELKGIKIKGEKTHDCYRWCMKGNAPKVGPDVQMQYCFSTTERTYVFRLTLRGEGWNGWNAEISEIFKSFEMLDAEKGK
jgi:hypothetical protein